MSSLVDATTCRLAIGPIWLSVVASVLSGDINGLRDRGDASILVMQRPGFCDALGLMRDRCQHLAEVTLRYAVEICRELL